MLQEWQEHLLAECAQPPPIWADPLLPAIIQLGLTEEEIKEVLENQEKWMREKEQR
jgi:hypothetical protein